MAQAGFMRGLLVGGILQALAVASFSILAFQGGDPTLFGLVMFFDNMGVAACGVALVTYMSTLTSIGYTATQYALLSSAYAFMEQAGFMRGLLVGGILQALAVASFSILAFQGGDPTLFGLVMFFDNMGVAACGVALVTYMSTLTSIGYTATQYALLSSAYAFL